MSVLSGGRAGVGGVSGGVEDRVDASYVLSWFLLRVVESVPHARPGSGEFSLGGVLWKTVLCGLAYVAGVACGWLVLTDDGQDWVRAWIADSGFLAVLSGLAVANLLGRFEGGKARPGPWFVVGGCWGVGVSAGDAAGAQRVRVVGGGGGIVCGAVLDAGQGDGVGWRVLVLVLRGGRCRRLVVRAGHAGDQGVRGHAS